MEDQYDDNIYGGDCGNNIYGGDENGVLHKMWMKHPMLVKSFTIIGFVATILIVIFVLILIVMFLFGWGRFSKEGFSAYGSYLRWRPTIQDTSSINFNGPNPDYPPQNFNKEFLENSSALVESNMG